jgi:hypothetical protein
MKKCDGIKEGNVLWRIDFLGEFDAPTYCFSIDEAHKIGSSYGKPYIVSIIKGDRLQELSACQS